MSHLGVDRRGEEQGQSQSRKLFCAIKLTLNPDPNAGQKGKTTFNRSVRLVVVEGLSFCSCAQTSIHISMWHECGAIVCCVCIEWKLSEVLRLCSAD